jgi:hypothetical protein
MDYGRKNIDSNFELMQYRDRELMENLLQKRMIHLKWPLVSPVV